MVQHTPKLYEEDNDTSDGGHNDDDFDEPVLLDGLYRIL